MAISVPSYATSYYVTQAGSGSKDGSSLANAWSLATYNSATQPTGGDTVFFSGTITSTVTPASSGFGNGNSRLVLDFTGNCAGCTQATLSANPGIQLNGRNYITLNGGVYSSSVTGTLVSINNTACHDFTINGWTHNGPSSGTSNLTDFFGGSAAAAFVTVSNNYCDNCVYGYNDSARNHDITISGNYIASDRNTSGQTDVIAMGDAYNITIEKNKLINRAPGNSSNSRHNDVIQTFRSGSSASGNPRNWTIRYNWIEVAQQDGSGGNMSWMELENFTGQPALKVYGNVFVGGNSSWSGGNGISLHSGTNSSDQYYFYNNTVVEHASPLNPIRLGEGDGPGSLFMRNNIGFADSDFSGDAPQITFTPVATWDHNYFYNFANCTSTFAGPNGSCSTNPLFSNSSANDFSLQANSPLLAEGDSAIGSEFNQGIAPGATWPNPTLNTRSSSNWNIGAYQSGGGSSSNVNPPTGLTASVQ